MILNLVDWFDGFSGEIFVIVGDRFVFNEILVVETCFDCLGEEFVGFDYCMWEVGLGWRVIDIYFDGKVSEIVLWRVEYVLVLCSGGIESLIIVVSVKIEKCRGVE